jgi:histidinol-phosphate/aromatic aminotransferase/cobyric acid decarboxylase-like protein/GNAT superfamily N-acetyltransferase
MKLERSLLSKARFARDPAPEVFVVSAASDADRDEIYRIRHEVYARELGQHPVNGAELLRDSLDDSNVYIVAKFAGKVVGFVSLTTPGQSRYSIDKYFARETLPFPVDPGLYEIRLLTVLRIHRGRELAMMLMYAAFRWVESHGGQQIVAIGRREILDLYVKAGLKPMGMATHCGLVTYDLLYALVSDIRKTLKQFRGLLARIESRADWRLDFSFHRPAACFHGGDFFKAVGEGFQTLERKQSIINADVLDAWFPPSPQVGAALKEHMDWLAKTSPPTECTGLIQAIAKERGLKAMNILPGAGSSDLIFRALPHWLSPASHAMILDPTYGEYAHVLERVVGATVDRLILGPESNYDVDLERLRNALKDGYDLVVLVNPNSPTGRHIPRPALEEILRGAPVKTRIWVDETYVDFTNPTESLEKFAAQRENVMVCKSMSKAYALSGLRVAYLCAGAHHLEGLRAITPPWVVSLPAQLAATIALKDSVYYQARYAETHSLRERLAVQLEGLGWQVIPGVANFLLAHLPENGPSAERLVGECRRQGLFLRNAGLMGSQVGARSVRIAVKDVATNARMIEIIRNAQRRAGTEG